MLLGEHEHTLDEKSRLTLPAKLRDSFAGGGVVTRGMEGCLYLFPREEWEKAAADQLASLNPLSRDGRMMRRYFFASAAEVEPDKQGRIMLPAPLLRHANLGRELVVAGVYDHLEIWDRAAWRQQLQTVEGSAEHVAERLATRRD